MPDARDPGRPRKRDAARSRTEILDAAERIFAEKGYEGTSLKEIGEAAGVSRGTPSYFFGTKEGLYLTVKARLSEFVREFAEEARTAAGTEGDQDPREVLAQTMRIYMDFLASRPTYMRFIEREAAGEDAFLEKHEVAPPGTTNLAETLGSFGRDFLERELSRGSFREVETAQLAASMVAVCAFPFLMGGGLVRTLGIDPEDPGFLEARKRHVVDLVLRGISREDGP